MTAHERTTHLVRLSLLALPIKPEKRPPESGLRIGIKR